jgi:hypothetical protein
MERTGNPCLDRFYVVFPMTLVCPNGRLIKALYCKSGFTVHHIVLSCCGPE